MGKQAGPLRLTGTHTDLTLYEMDGQFLFRKKTSLTKQRVKTDPAFAKSRRASAQFGAAAVLAKKVYWSLPKEKRKHGLIGRLTGIANRLLQSGANEEEVITQLNKV
jgi:hypothetical protein